MKLEKLFKVSINETDLLSLLGKTVSMQLKIYNKYGKQ